MISSPAVLPAGVDTHQHFWRYHPRDYPWIDDRHAPLKRDFTPADVWPAMQRAGFGGAIAVQARQTADETASLLAWADQHPWVAGVVGWVDLTADDVEGTLSRAAHPKLIGIRHIVQDEPDDRYLLRPDFCRGVSTLARAGLTYDILVLPRHLPVVATFVDRFPEQRFVLDHLAKPDIRNGAIDQWAKDLAQVAAHPHVWAKLSGLVTEADWDRWSPEQLLPYLDVAFDVFGANRLMVGSDWPVSTLAGEYEAVMGVFVEYLSRRPEAERAAVQGGNARRLWNISDRRGPAALKGGEA